MGGISQTTGAGVFAEGDIQTLVKRVFHSPMGTTSRCCSASLARCATGRRSRTCLSRCSGCDVACCARPAATG